MALPPMAGFTVAVTADRRREEQVELLRRRGADVIEGPSIRTMPLADDALLHRALDDLVARPPQFTVLLTGLGVRSLLGAAESMGRGEDVLDAITSSRVCARGPKATGAALTAGIEVEWRTVGDRSSELLDRLSGAAAGGARIAVQRDGDARPLLANALRAMGAEVIDLPVYEWSLPEDVGPAVRIVDAVCAGGVDAITFTSSPALRNLVALAAHRRDALVDACNSKGVVVTCIGPVCADTARSIGIADVVMPPRPRLGSMVLALASVLGTRRRTVALGGVNITLQGAMVVVGKDQVRLTDRERGVLHALADAAGAVVTKPALLQRVWDASTDDEHTVEVTVGRLRRRLGRAGDAILTVPRRGYRLA